MPRIAAHRDPLSAAEYNALGEAYMQKGEKPAATRQYEAALRKDKEHIPSLVALGNIAYDEKSYGKARDYFRRILKVEPNDVSGINNLAMVDLAEGKNLDDSRKNVERVLPTAGPMRPYLLDTLANIAIHQNRKEDAQAAIHQARQEAPSNDSQFLINLAVTEEKLQSRR